ncbi:MAG: hypothetical protein A4E60_00207 [Syntrophorhabdus sp. PtaB.Bin047]|jgi:hypothetical protein|nr:MAG: hypothetical protein A4E60_00207 [Syntrophorhabdus sp. PtaB.Bin047]
MIVYVSSPYSAETIEQVKANVAFANEIGKQALVAGHVPIIPHVMSAFWDLDGRLQNFSHADWMFKYALPLLEIADAILLAGSWESSKGCLIELGRARGLGKKIFYGMDELKKYKEVTSEDYRHTA